MNKKFCVLTMYTQDIKELGVTVEVEMAMVGYTILKSQADIEPAFRMPIPIKRSKNS